MFVRTISAQALKAYSTFLLCLLLSLTHLSACGNDYLVDNGEEGRPALTDGDSQADGDKPDGDLTDLDGESHRCPQEASDCQNQCHQNIAYTCEIRFDQYDCRVNIPVQEDCLDALCIVDPETGIARCENSDGDQSTDGDIDDGEPLDGDLDDPTDGDKIDDAVENDWSLDGDGVDGEDDPFIDGDVVEVSISGFMAFENPVNVLSFFVEWQTDVAVSSRLEVDCGHEYRRVFIGSNPTVEHKIFVMGLLDTLQCTFTALTPSDSASQLVTVGPLPAELPELEVVYVEPARIQAGWTLFNLSNKYDQIPLIVAMVDELGRYRWYYKVLTNASGSDNDVSTVPEGVLIGGTYGAIYPHIISWDGRILWKEEISMHHHIAGYGENQLIYFWRERSCTGEDWVGHENLFSDMVVIWDRETREPAWTWVFCHHYTPETITSDWAHANSVEIFPGEQAMLISSRKMSSLFKVDMSTGEVIWKMGRDGDFSISGDAIFYHQHAAEILPNGNILLFDNGDADYRKYSRALELSIRNSDKGMIAEKVWSYTPEPAYYAFMWGDADRLPNGNTLSTFGVRSTNVKSRLVEASADNPGQLVWQLDLALRWGVYRAERIPNPPFGYFLDSLSSSANTSP